MIKEDYEELKDLAQNNVCAEHGLPLALVWNREESCHTLRCGYGAGHFPDELVRKLSPTEELKAGTELPEPVKSGVERGMAKRQAMAGPAAVTIGGVLASDAATGELIPKVKLQALVEWGRNLGLKPELGHVCLYQGEPYVTIDGYLYHADDTGVPYTMLSAPIPGEQREGYILEEGDHGWLARIRRLDTGGEFVGVGIVTRKEMTEMSRKKPDRLRSSIAAEKPWQIAQKRAEWQALRRAFPLGGEE